MMIFFVIVVVAVLQELICVKDFTELHIQSDGDIN